MSRTLLDILTTLTFRERNYIFSLLDHTEIIRLSACNHSLREIVCNNNVLWRKLYKCHFLSGAYRTKEWEFVFWCFRTDPNTISMPARRSDVVNNVDWYNTYRRRIATENNWRHSYSNTTEMDIEMGNEEGKSGVIATYISTTCVTLSYNDCEVNGGTNIWYNIEYPAYSDLKHDGNKHRRCPFSTLLETTPVYGDNAVNLACKTIFLNGHYVIGCKRDDQQSETTRTAALLSRGSKDKSTYVAIDIPPNIKIKTINGKWALLCDISTENYRPKYAKITMLDMENAVKHSSSIDDIWDATCFYETNDRSATVYTAKFKKAKRSCIEWALHQFSGTSQLEQIRSGWFYLPDINCNGPKRVYVIDQSQIVLDFLSRDRGVLFYNVVHSVASSGQGDTPKNRTDIGSGVLPIPLLKAGLQCYGTKAAIYYCESFNDDQFIRYPNFYKYCHVIGSLYCILVGSYRGRITYLIDIDKKAIVRQIDNTHDTGRYINYLFTGSKLVTEISKQSVMIMNEYGAL